jgi:hypothetical protein
VDPNFFATVGMRIVAGRDFNDSDVNGAPLVAIVNTSFAKLFWPGHDPIGQCILMLNMATTRCPIRVVGVVVDSKLVDVLERRQPYLFTPVAQGGAVSHMVTVRTAGLGARLVPAIRAAIVPIPHPGDVAVRPLSDLIAAKIAPWRTARTLLSAFGLLALIITVCGVFGTTTFVLAIRRRELAIQLAIGAHPRGLARRLTIDRLVETAAGCVLFSTVLLATLNRWTAEEATTVWLASGVGCAVVVFAISAASALATRRLSEKNLVALLMAG